MPKNTFFNLEYSKRKKILESAINEFSDKAYEQVNLSVIIKNADITRGSFYQYFTDKKDLYLYIIDIIKEKKMEYLSDAFNRSDFPFLDLVLSLYKLGIIFAIDHPKYVKIFDKLLHNQNEIYENIMKENLNYAVDYYSKLINQDKDKGLIRKDIDTYTLAKIISDLTTNVTINDLDLSHPKESYEKMNKNIHHILNILRKGVEVHE